MKRTNLIYILIILLFCYVEPLFSISVGLGNDTNEIIGYIAVPVSSLVVTLLFLLVSRVFFHQKYKYKLSDWRTNKTESLIVLIPLLITVLLNIVTSTSIEKIFQELPIGQLILGLVISLISAAIVGFTEETLVRGALLNSLMKIFSSSKYRILLSSIISSVLFGALHLLNILNGQAVAETLYQVLYAAAIGFCFSMIVFITKSLAIPIIVHTIIDWSDYFFNMSGSPILQNEWYIPVILTVLYVGTGVFLYKSMMRKEPQAIVD